MKNNRAYISLEVAFFVAIAAVVVSIILFVAVACVGFPGGLGANYSEGSRAGTIVKLSHKGLIFKSWEAQAVLGGLRTDGDGKAVANTFNFNVSENARPTVETALNTGVPVKLTYHQYLFHPVSIDSDYVVTDATLLKP